MAFQVRNEKGTTVVVITDPRLAAAARAVGYMWDDVKDQPAAEGMLAEIIEALEQFSERLPSVLPTPGGRKAARGRQETLFVEV